jgi:hypothetical protein
VGGLLSYGISLDNSDKSEMIQSPNTIASLVMITIALPFLTYWLFWIAFRSSS